MLKHTLTLQIFEPELAICRLPPTSPFPEWIGDKDFVSVTRTPDELSIVCYEAQVPSEVKAERDWRMLGIKGPLDFSMTGVLASLVRPLSDAGIAVFAISTYDTDYLLVKTDCFERAMEILKLTCIIENRKEK
jgi:uncharacterized protein